MKRIFYVITCAFIVSCSTAPKEKNVNTSTVEITDEVLEQGSNAASGESTTSAINTDDEKTVSNTDETNSNDWDTAIDEYEKYINEYVKFAKKGKSGDATALMESLELMSKAESAGKRLNAANNGDMTNEQIKRFAKIQTKILDAL